MNRTYLLDDVMQHKFEKGISAEKLWEFVQDKKEQQFKLEDVKHWIYTPCWSTKDDCFISIYQVLMQKTKFKDHIKRIKKSNTDYPIVVIEDHNDNYGVILDGNHRFAKQYMNNARNIKFKYITIKEFKKLESSPQ